VPLRGGPREPPFTDPKRLPAGFFLRSVSPDERWALGSYGSAQGSGLAVVPIGDNGAVRTFPYAYTPGEGFGCTWAPGATVNAFEDLVFRDGATNLWRFPSTAPCHAPSPRSRRSICCLPLVTRREDARPVPRDDFDRHRVDHKPRSLNSRRAVWRHRSLHGSPRRGDPVGALAAL